MPYLEHIFGLTRAARRTCDYMYSVKLFRTKCTKNTSSTVRVILLAFRLIHVWRIALMKISVDLFIIRPRAVLILIVLAMVLTQALPVTHVADCWTWELVCYNDIIRSRLN